MNRLLTSLLLLLILPNCVFGQKVNRQKIIKISKDKLTYETYTFAGQNSFTISDLELDAKEVKKERVIIANDLRLFLLKNGLAKLKNTKNANSKELEAQSEAKANKIGLWSKPSKVDSFISWLKKLWLENWKKILSAVLGSGFVFTWLYTKIFIERKIYLLIIGQASSGKTALYNRLCYPETPKDYLLNLSPTEKNTGPIHGIEIPLTTRKGKKKKLIPLVKDHVGTDHASMIDSILGKRTFRASKKILVVTLSPTRAKQLNEDSKQVDKDYVAEQYGALQVILSTSLQSKAMKDKKPIIVILFLTKFDLYSAYHPDDRRSTSNKQQFESYFKKHITYAKRIGGQTNVTIKCITGSSIEDWGVKQITSSIKRNFQ